MDKKINICTSCKKRIIGYYFCPECGQEGSSLTSNKKNNSLAIAKWIPHELRIIYG